MTKRRWEWWGGERSASRSVALEPVSREECSPGYAAKLASPELRDDGE